VHSAAFLGLVGIGLTMIVDNPLIEIIKMRSASCDGRLVTGDGGGCRIPDGAGGPSGGRQNTGRT
jgi:hypothetical protein